MGCGFYSSLGKVFTPEPCRPGTVPSLSFSASMRCADLQALGVFPQDLLPDNLMVNTRVWCSEELSCENPAAAFTVFVLDNMTSQDYSSHVLPFCQTVFQQICFGCQLVSDWPKFTFTFSCFPCDTFYADSESQTDRQVRSRREPDYGKAWESQGMACCRLYTWLLQMAMEMAWPDASYCMILARRLFWGLCPGYSQKIKALIEAERKAVLWYLNKELGL